jgi:hypothetical protein
LRGNTGAVYREEAFGAWHHCVTVKNFLTQKFNKNFDKKENL